MRITFIIILLHFLIAIGFQLNAQLPADFFDETLSTSLAKPVGITFDQSGKGYIWEQSGLVHILDTTSTLLTNPLIDIREEVSEFVDHGLLGFTLHPKFDENGYIYLLYVVDPHHLYHFGTSEYDPNTTIINEATIGRITRYTADINNNFESIIPESRKVIIGTTPENGFPIVASSHGVGTLTFGTDETLLASCGETGSFLEPDAGNFPESFFEKALENNIIRPAENVGAYRSQLINSLAGKVIRIDPETGRGLPSNPYYNEDEPDAPASKVWLRGLRNPFRIYLAPGTGSHNQEDANPGVLFIGDVGSKSWEELNIATEGGLNFGWPIYEGMSLENEFGNLIRENQDSPNPLYNQNGCDQEFFTFHDLIQQPNALISPVFPNPCSSLEQIPESLQPSIHQRPTLAWLNHNQMTDSVAVVPAFNESGDAIDYEIENSEANVEGIHFNGSSSLAGFYYTGDNFPEEYQGRYFHADFKGWISVFDFDNSYNLTRVDTFAKGIQGIVDLRMSPKDGCIYYIKALEGPSINRICYGGDPPPVAVAKSNITYGPSPLHVELDASESYHPKDYPFTLEWKLPDGTTSDQVIFEFDFTTNTNEPTRLEVELALTDSVGNTNTDQLVISLNNTPPQVEITSVEEGHFYPISDFTYLPLRAEVSDQEHNPEELNYEWQAFLYHNNHNHAGPIETSKEAFALLEPVGCNGETYWYRIELTVSDPAGLSTKDIVEIFPDCDEPFGQDIDLSGFSESDYNVLEWLNLDESNLIEYEVQRSVNKTDFVCIATLEIGETGTYAYNDTDPNWGINYYRIKAIQQNGKYDYSNKIELDFNSNKEVTVYPNPTENILTVDVKSSTGTIYFDLYNALGKQVLTGIWPDDIRDGVVRSLSISHLPNGVYYYQVDNGSEKFKGSILKIR